MALYRDGVSEGEVHQGSWLMSKPHAERVAEWPEKPLAYAPRGVQH